MALLLANCFWLLAASASAQNMERDTMALEGVEVFAPALDKYAQGQTVRAVSKENLEEFHGQDLGSLLQQRSGIFVRQHGPGMIASVTMRGTSAGHTAVFWNGLPINSPSLGQLDFSLVPVNGIDAATIHHGSSGALYGTDAIGGSIHLSSRLAFNKGSRLNLQQGVGSFGRYNSQARYSYSNSRFATSTRIYRNFAQNNFPFVNRAKFGTPVERQENARVEQIGASQDLAFSLSEKSQLSTSVWWNRTDREIQPVMGSSSQEVQKDQNLRWVVDYYRFGAQATWNVKGGLVHDELFFNRTSRNLVTQYFLASDVEHQISQRWETRSGIRYTHIFGNLSTYEATDNRIELYHSSNFAVTDRLGLSLNLRQLVYEGNWAPFTPALSGKYEIISAQNHQIFLNGALSRSFKVPTLNDRFWQPGGNPDLLPEESISGELGFAHPWKKDGSSLEWSANYYRMQVENWIIWLPNGNFWEPNNIREVNNSGVELFVRAGQKLGKWNFGLEGDYTLARAINQTNIDENDRSAGKQLPYTPEHKAQLTTRAAYGNLSAFVNGSWVGQRFVATDNKSVLGAYQLWNVGGRYDWTYGKLSGQLALQVNNLMGENYEVLRLRPMPGRNYQINLSINI